jgi:hypothetical protein
MRTTIDIEEDVLLAAREIAREKRVSIGKGLSDLARRSLTSLESVSYRSGVPLFPVRSDAGIMTLELVNRLRDEGE